MRRSACVVPSSIPPQVYNRFSEIAQLTEIKGTVEFLVDDEASNFFFLEMNTRIQVSLRIISEIIVNYSTTSLGRTSGNGGDPSRSRPCRADDRARCSGTHSNPWPRLGLFHAITRCI